MMSILSTPTQKPGTRRSRKRSPTQEPAFYHLLAQNETGSYEAYVSEQNLIAEENPVPVEHPGIMDYFDEPCPDTTSCAIRWPTRTKSGGETMGSPPTGVIRFESRKNA